MGRSRRAPENMGGKERDKKEEFKAKETENLVKTRDVLTW